MSQIEILQRRVYKLESLLWHAIHKNHPLSPSGCTPCKEIDQAMTEYIELSKYRQASDQTGEKK